MSVKLTLSIGPGDIVASRHAGALIIERADPRILIADVMMAEIATGRCPEITWTGAYPCSETYACSHVIGGVLRIDAANRAVVYRVTGVDGRGYVAEWPD